MRRSHAAKKFLQEFRRLAPLICAALPQLPSYVVWNVTRRSTMNTWSFPPLSSSPPESNGEAVRFFQCNTRQRNLCSALTYALCENSRAAATEWGVLQRQSEDPTDLFALVCARRCELL